MIKHLISHGNSKALVIDKALLQAAGLPEDVSFKITIGPSGITIQSVGEEAPAKKFREIGNQLLKKRKKLYKKLANQ